MENILFNTAMMFAFTFAGFRALVNFFIFLKERENGDRIDRVYRKLNRLREAEKPAEQESDMERDRRIGRFYVMPCRPISRFA